MKKIFYSIIAALGLFSFSSCGDMLKVENDSMLIDPDLSSKTDSVFYALGIVQTLQQLADQYFLIGEMRGDLTKTTTSSSIDLQQLANYSATGTNKYDSAYVYYKVINNCNYYLKHRNKELYTGSVNVVINEYAAVAAIRAWAYLQLSRTYGGNEVGIPFFTEPITTVSMINEDNFPKKTLNEIVDALAPELETYSGCPVPDFGGADKGISGLGTPNWGGSEKGFFVRRGFVPVDVILGEMYLEKGEYMRAAQHYAFYLCKNKKPCGGEYNGCRKTEFEAKDIPDDMSFLNKQNSFCVSGASFGSIYNANPSNEIVTYIPMANNSQRGTISQLPIIFGYDYYSIDRSSNCPRLEKIQVAPSDEFFNLTEKTDYYYYKTNGVASYPNEIGKIAWGDGRGNYSIGGRNSSGVILSMDETDTTKVYISKAQNANITVFRVSTIYLHLAEALNRAGYPDLAFAILRNGISCELEDMVAEAKVDPSTGEVLPITDDMYLSRNSINLLQSTLYFLNAEYRTTFEGSDIYGIHNHGGGFNLKTTNGKAQEAKSGTPNPVTVQGSLATAVGSRNNLMYLPKPIAQAKIDEINRTFGVNADINNPQDMMVAMELVLCDEYGREFAFEGCRFYDLQRMARHLNESGVFGGNFGSRWFAEKLKNNNPTKSLMEPKNWYLPFN